MSYNFSHSLALVVSIMFEALSFRYPFRKYQRMILDTIVPENADNKYHIVAPPGSGKTIVGLELIRRFEQPAVVFAPTTTIQEQWREKLNLFVDDPTVLDDLVSTDPKVLRPINIFTYQLISVPENARKLLNEMAEKAWVEDLLLNQQASDEAAARERLHTLKVHHPTRYREELSRRALRLKRQLLREPQADIAHFLHPNARTLIDNLVEYGVRTVVLDECHHLLDYWAIVLRYLINRIEEPHIIGLTATLPNPDGDEEFENYDALLGEVDFEVPTPAVVKEGDLAPYRDLVLFVQPTSREREYLKNISKEFAHALSILTGREKFRAWVTDLVTAPTLEAWEAAWRERPLTMLAALRWLLPQGWQPPAEYPVPQECYQRIQIEDWMVLIERHALDVLALSEDSNDHVLLQQLRKVLYGFGFTLTESGLRQQRSPGDMVLTFSESKDHATAIILEEEYRALGERLRAVVVTDFERMNSGVRRLKGVLAPDAGSAWRLFETLVRNPNLRSLSPVLVTGQTVRCAAVHAEILLAAINQKLLADGYTFSCIAKPENEHVVRIISPDGKWTPRVYVPIMTELLNEGITKCLVGTRGIFGEGWDAVKLNTLIDLTSVTTSTSVQQLRGRSLRKDPDWPRKVAHNWDVICIAPDFERGDLDFERFIKRHARYWGLMLFAGAKKESFQAPYQGWVVRGWPHVLPELPDWLHETSRPYAGMEKVNQYMLAQVARRDWVYDMWKVGEEYSNFNYRTTQVHAANLKIRTVFTLQDTVKSIVRDLLGSLIGGAILFASASRMITSALPAELSFLILLIMTALGAILLSLQDLRRAFRKLLLEQPPDLILLDIARATLASLREIGKVSPRLSDDFIRTIETPGNAYQVLVDYASPEDSDLFARTVEQIFAPIVDQRYLIWRTDERLPHWMLNPFWKFLRVLVRRAWNQPPAYYAVPDILASRKSYAEIFARYWQRYVGGGELIYTRTETGRRILLQARAQRRLPVKTLAFEFWR